MRHIIQKLVKSLRRPELMSPSEREGLFPAPRIPRMDYSGTGHGVAEGSCVPAPRGKPIFVGTAEEMAERFGGIVVEREPGANPAPRSQDIGHSWMQPHPSTEGYHLEKRGEGVDESGSAYVDVTLVKDGAPAAGQRTNDVFSQSLSSHGENELFLEDEVPPTDEKDRTIWELRQQIRAILSRQPPIVEYDDGSSVVFSACAGGAAEGGAWSTVQLGFVDMYDNMKLRDYVAINEPYEALSDEARPNPLKRLKALEALAAELLIVTGGLDQPGADPLVKCACAYQAVLSMFQPTPDGLLPEEYVSLSQRLLAEQATVTLQTD